MLTFFNWIFRRKFGETSVKMQKVVCKMSAILFRCWCAKIDFGLVQVGCLYWNSPPWSWASTVIKQKEFKLCLWHLTLNPVNLLSSNMWVPGFLVSDFHPGKEAALSCFDVFNISNPLTHFCQLANSTMVSVKTWHLFKSGEVSNDCCIAHRKTLLDIIWPFWPLKI